MSTFNEKNIMLPKLQRLLKVTELKAQHNFAEYWPQGVDDIYSSFSQYKEAFLLA